MDGGVTDGESEQQPAAKSAETYADIFDRLFPEYLLIGMTPEQYWDGEVGLLRAYRKAYIQRMEYENERRDVFAWTLGRYFRDALQSVYLLVNGFVPKKSSALPYPEQPYSIKERERVEKENKQKAEERKKKAEEDKIKQSMAYFQAAVAQYNKNFKKRQELAEQGKPK